MGNHGDDCYFFYYSTCTKGDSCPFRHCEAALGNEIVCNLWQEGHCFRTACKFRHMEITKNRKEIPCYWENQAAGCQKPHCAFFHEKPRSIDGMFFPADKSQNMNVEQSHEEQAPPPAVPSSVSPQLRGVIKPDAMEPVPSPTHPPVVINPADDDEDEDDEGEIGPSPRKNPRSDDSLNFGVSTLEEVRLRKALKASMKRAGYTTQNADVPVASEKTGRPRGSVAERVGHKMPHTDMTYGEYFPLKRSLADRLGKVLIEEQQSIPQKTSKSVKDRLGLSTGSAINAPAEMTTDSKKAPEQIHIKTLEEIRKEKAAKSLSKDLPLAPESSNTKPTKGLRRITMVEQPVSNIKTSSDILCSTRKGQEMEERAKLVPKKAAQCESGPVPVAPNLGGIQVKTLEEIRREKAARIEAQQGKEAENKKSCDTEDSCAKKPRLLLIKKPVSQSNITTEKSPKVTEKPPKAHAVAPTTSITNGDNVKVKTFEEIMQEKRLRKQEMEERARALTEAGPDQKQAAEENLKRKVPKRVNLTSPGSSSLSPTAEVPNSAVSTQRVPVRKLIPPKAASPLNSSTQIGTRGAAAASLPENQSAFQQKPHKNTSQAKQARAVPQRATEDVPVPDITLKSNQKKLTTDTKVRPKLNVKPSVMKPEAHVKPGQKRRGAERSAIAAVKPLNSTSTVQEEPLQMTTCNDRQVFPSSSSEDQLSSAVPCKPSTLLKSDSSSSLKKEELQTVPVFKQNKKNNPAVSVAAAKEVTVSQSPVLKSPTLPKTRRVSSSASQAASAAATSAVDDFDKLIMEFTDEDMLDDGVDNDVDEDDLLQELSEMIEIDG